MLDHLHDAAALEARIVLQFHRIMHRTGRHPGAADQLHRLHFGALAGPRSNDLVDLVLPFRPSSHGFIARVADQIFAPDDLQEPRPVFRVGAAGEDIDVVVGTAGLAGIDVAGRGRARDLGAATLDCLARFGLAREGHPHVVDHRVLHRDLQASALAGPVAPVERTQNADRHQHAGARVAKGGARLDRRPARLAGDAHRAAGGLGDHVEGEVLLVGAAFAEALDLAIDDTGVELPDDIIAAAQPLDRAGRHVLDRHIRLLQQVLDDLETARRFEVEGDRLLVGVELVEIPRVIIGLPGPQSAAGIPGLRVLDLDHLGAEPGERLGAGGAGLELRKIDHPNAFETIQLYANSIHRSSLLPTNTVFDCAGL